MNLSLIPLMFLTAATPVHLEPASIPEWANRAYGEDLLFEIRREGRKIGTHRVEFNWEDGVFRVETRTRIKVKFLFFTAYRFEYTSSELWQDGLIDRVLAFTDENGKEREYSIDYEARRVTVQDGSNVVRYDMETTPYPTNHWHPQVLSTSRVVNTLSGNLNNVEISPVSWELVPAGEGERRAMRFDYNGDLNDVSAWYDEQGRWVGLRFKGSDGSEITYECIRCGA